MSPAIITEISCVYCAGGLVCIKDRYYCVNCGERNKLPETLSIELKEEKDSMYSKIIEAKNSFSKKKVRARATRPKHAKPKAKKVVRSKKKK